MAITRNAKHYHATQNQAFAPEQYARVIDAQADSTTFEFLIFIIGKYHHISNRFDKTSLLNTERPKFKPLTGIQLTEMFCDLHPKV